MNYILIFNLGESLGGDLYFLGALHLMSPIVFDASDGSIPISVRVHSFFNFGNSIQGNEMI
jgi:outer membrane protein assembly factor BamA